MLLVLQPDRRRGTDFSMAVCPDCEAETVNLVLRTTMRVFYRCLSCGKIWSQRPAAGRPPDHPWRRSTD